MSKALSWLIIAIIVALAVLAVYVHQHLGFGYGTIAILYLLAYPAYRAVKWAFWPCRELPRNRVRRQRIRLYLRLHPGPGHATVFELHRQWGRRAAYKRSARVQVRSS